ncbi:hypothetical protein [Capnocytophaga canis]|uniref:hypothetical protein n=1 Tax=Capnocytophaga canis TaxID=1848903 RepID=UPI0009E4FF5B|nr:hypothetical protein [Capnocytophaga canis]
MYFPKGIECFPKGINNIPNGIRHFPEGIKYFPKGMDNIPNDTRHFLVGAKCFSPIYCVLRVGTRCVSSENHIFTKGIACFPVGAYCNTPVHYVERL